MRYLGQYYSSSFYWFPLQKYLPWTCVINNVSSNGGSFIQISPSAGSWCRAKSIVDGVCGWRSDVYGLTVLYGPSLFRYSMLCGPWFPSLSFANYRGWKATRWGKTLGCTSREDAAALPVSAVSSILSAVPTTAQRRSVAIMVKYASFEFMIQFPLLLSLYAIGYVWVVRHATIDEKLRVNLIFINSKLWCFSIEDVPRHPSNKSVTRELLYSICHLCKLEQKVAWNAVSVS